MFSPSPRLGVVFLSLSFLSAGCDLFEFDEIVESSRDLNGRWVGTGGNGAKYQDNVANPNCRYEADLVLDLVQNGDNLAGQLTLTVRKSEKLLQTSLPCVAVGSSATQALTGNASITNVDFTLADGTEFDGTFTTDIMSGNFASAGPNGIAGTWVVLRQ